jgi:hypothetical protein
MKSKYEMMVLVLVLFCIMQRVDTQELFNPSVCQSSTHGIKCTKEYILPDYDKLPRCYHGKGSGLPVDDTEGYWLTMPLANDKKKMKYNVTEMLLNTKTSPIYASYESIENLSQYKRIWMPSKCKYHRFTSKTLKKYLLIKKKKINVAFFGDSVLRGVYCGINRIISGDESGELFGPNIDPICGGLLEHGSRRRNTPVSYSKEGIVLEGVKTVTAAGEGDTNSENDIHSSSYYLNTSFSYIRHMNNHANVINANLTMSGTLDTIASYLKNTSTPVKVKVKHLNNRNSSDSNGNINSDIDGDGDGDGDGDRKKLPSTQIDIIIIASGAWDFYTPTLRVDQRTNNAMTTFPYNISIDECYNKEYESASKKRTQSNDSQMFIRKLNNLCHKYNVKCIYKNNHHNCRYGTKCADEEYEKLLLQKVYHNTDDSDSDSDSDSNGDVPGVFEIWDTKNVTSQHWYDQTWDGLHFDRQPLHSLQDHYRAHWGGGYKFHGKFLKFPHMGELEITLANSLLNRAVFSDDIGRT